jgi:hypothetical protein
MTAKPKPAPKLPANGALSQFTADTLAKPDEVEAVLASVTPAQREKVLALARRYKDRVTAPPMKLALADGVLQITYAHADPVAANLLLMAESGTCDPGFLTGISGQVARIGAQGARIDETASNFLLSVVRAVEPRDELETMLAVQMGAIHQATMMMARRLNHVDNLAQQDAAERALNKLARTYAMQMEALKRYRTGGHQKVTVEHVTVNAGGQAIVGAVATGGGGCIRE